MKATYKIEIQTGGTFALVEQSTRNTIRAGFASHSDAWNYGKRMELTVLKD